MAGEDYNPLLIEEPPGTPGPLAIPAAPRSLVAPPSSASSEVDALLQSQIDKLKRTDSMGFLDRLAGGNRQRREALEAIPALSTLRSTIQKPEELQREYTKLLVETAKSVAAMDPATQEKLIPVLGPTLIKLNTLAGVNVDQNHLLAAFTQPGAADAMANVFLNSAVFSDDERKVAIEGAKGLKGPALKSYYDDVIAKKLAQAEPRLRQMMPNLVAAVRRTLPDPAAPLNVSDFQAKLVQLDPSLTDPLGAQVLGKVLADDGFVENLGLQSAGRSKKAAEVQEEVKGAKEKAQIAPERLGADFNRFARELYPNKRADQLNDEEAKAVNARVAKERVDISAAQGSASVDVKQRQPLTPKERAELVDVGALQNSLDLVQPPAGTTHGSVATSGQYVAIDDKQKGKIAGLKKSRVLIDQIFGLADQVITANTPAEALVQRGQRPTEAFFKSNPQAAAYRDARTAFLGNLSRELAEERGVLTNQDIERVGNALGDFSDTRQTLAIKKQIINDIWATSRDAAVGEISGKAQADSRKKIDDLLKRLDQVSGSEKAIKIKRSDGKGKVMMLAPGYPIPAGWEEAK